MNRETSTKWLQKYVTILMLMAILLPVASAITYPTLNGYVTDNANIIDTGYKQKITDLADKINKETTVEIAVLTIDSLEGDSLENYAVQTFRQNGVGKKDNNNGLLILVAKKDRKYRFEVGYGLESTIPDAMKVPIGDKIITPNFRNGDYGKGIYESMLAVEGLVTNNTEVLSKYGLVSPNLNSGSGREDSGAVILFVIFGIIVVAFILMIISDSRNSGKETYSSPSTSPSIPSTYRPPSYTRSSGSYSNSSSSRRSSNYGGYSHSSNSFGGGFKGFGGGRSGGGGFGGGW